MKIGFTGDLSFIDIDKFTDNPFSQIKEASDFNLVINLESVFLDKNTNLKPIKNKVCLKQNNDMIKHLIKLNPLLVNLSNNHINDYGEPGVKNTINLLKQSKINYFGAGLSNLNHNIYVLEKEKIAFFSYVTRDSDLSKSKLFNEKTFSGPKEYSLELQKEQFKKYKNYTKIILLHWGFENEHYPHPTQRIIARQIIDNGADLIIGNHSHVIQGNEQYKNKWIFYALGNFLFPTFETIVRNKLERYEQKNKNKESILPIFEVTKKEIKLVEIKYIKANDKFELAFYKKTPKYKLTPIGKKYSLFYNLYHQSLKAQNKFKSAKNKTKQLNKRLRLIKEKLKSGFVSNIYEPLYCKFYKKDKRLKHYKYYKKAQWNKLDENINIQAEKLYLLLDYATKNIPYYQKLKQDKKINISKKTIYKDIKKFPIMTKKEASENFDNLYVPIPNLKYEFKYSGGSTGEPIKLIHDVNYSAHASAITRLQLEWTGLRSGNTLIKLWGSQSDILQERSKLLNIFANKIKSIYILNSFLINEQKMNNYVKEINHKKPVLILAYADSMFELAKYIQKNKLTVFSPTAIMTSAGILYPEFRECIETTFKTKIFDRYGSREIGNVACECEKHEGLHISILTHYVEILNENLEPCKENESGDIYVTLLDNFTMPLIRYKIGDLATFTNKKCSCGRGLPLITNIVGRDNDIFLTKSGNKIPGEFFIHFLGVVYNEDAITKFQVIQKNYSNIEIKVIVKNKERFEKHRKNIEKVIKQTMDNDCKISWSYTKDIPSTKSGKYRYTIREF